VHPLKGQAVVAANLVIEIEEVLEARIQSLGTAADRVEKIFFFTSNCSVAASMMKEMLGEIN